MSVVPILESLGSRYPTLDSIYTSCILLLLLVPHDRLVDGRRCHLHCVQLTRSSMLVRLCVLSYTLLATSLKSALGQAVSD